MGVYDHVPGDGREFVVCHPSAVAIRAEDGRCITSLNISPFINNLPNSKSTADFSTRNASGSTSQAANVLEAVDIGAKVLLLDEDVCATNFMSRDDMMAALVSSGREPITPYLARVRELFDVHGVSSIIVSGGCGDFLRVADTVIMMDNYRAFDATARAREVVAHFPVPTLASSVSSLQFGGVQPLREEDISTEAVGKAQGRDDVKCREMLEHCAMFTKNSQRRRLDPRCLSLREQGRIFVRNIGQIQCGTDEDLLATATSNSDGSARTSQTDTPGVKIDVSFLEQIVEIGQTRAIAQGFDFIARNFSVQSEDGVRESQISFGWVVEQVDNFIDSDGLDILSGPGDESIFHGKLSRPRRLEIAAAIARYRKLNIIS